MDALFASLGLQGVKPLAAALVLPPLPLLLLVLVGARLIPWRRGVGWLVVIASVTLLWLSHTVAFGEWLGRQWLSLPRPLDVERHAQALQDPAARRATAIVVLGGGAEPLAPEYGASNLQPLALERLRYGLWLAGRTGAGVAFSGGVGHGAGGEVPEADVAARIAAQEFQRPLQWVEPHSTDTRDNAERTVALLRPQGVRELLLVTHGWHMERAARAFEQAIAQTGGRMQVVPAPVGLAPRQIHPVLRWLPSQDGFALTRAVVRESIGLLMGA